MKSAFVKLTAAVVIGGEIAKAGEIVEVTQAEAKDLLHRGKADVATAEDMPEELRQEAGEDGEPPAQAAPDAKPAGRARKTAAK